MNNSEKRLSIDQYDKQMTQLKKIITQEFKRKINLLENQMITYIDHMFNASRQKLMNDDEEILREIQNKNQQQNSQYKIKPSSNNLNPKINQSDINQSDMLNITKSNLNQNSLILKTSLTDITNNVDKNQLNNQIEKQQSINHQQTTQLNMHSIIANSQQNDLLIQNNNQQKIISPKTYIHIQQNLHIKKQHIDVSEKKEINKKDDLIQKVINYVEKLKEQNNFWLKKKSSSKTCLKYSLDFRKFVQYLGLIFNPKKEDILIEQWWSDKKILEVRRKIQQFLTFYNEYKQHISQFINIEQIMLNCFPFSKQFTMIFDVDWIGLQLVNFQTRQRYYDSVEEYQFENFIFGLSRIKCENKKDLKVSIEVNFLYTEWINILWIYKFTFSMEITINYITEQTCKALKQINKQQLSNFIIIIPQIKDIQEDDQGSQQVQINLELTQLVDGTFDKQLSYLPNFHLDMKIIQMKAILLRKLCLQNYIPQHSIKNHSLFQKELFNLYTFDKSRHFTLRIVYFINYSQIIDQFQWSQVQTILYYNESTAFNDSQHLFSINQLSIQRLKRFPNLKLIVIDINELNEINRTLSQADFYINIHQQTLLHIFILMQQFQSIQFKFVDIIEEKGVESYLNQQNFESYEKMKEFLLGYKKGKKISIINYDNNKIQKQMMQIIMNHQEVIEEKNDLSINKKIKDSSDKDKSNINVEIENKELFINQKKQQNELIIDQRQSHHQSQSNHQNNQSSLLNNNKQQQNQQEIFNSNTDILYNSVINQLKQQQQHSKFNNVKYIDPHPFQPILEGMSISHSQQIQNSKELIQNNSNKQNNQVQNKQNKEAIPINQIKPQQIEMKQQQNEIAQLHLQNQDSHIRQFLSFQGQFDNISQIGNFKKIDEDQQNRIFFQKQKVYEYVNKLKAKRNIFWLRKLGSDKNSYLYSFDLRQLNRVYVAQKNVFTQIVDQSNYNFLMQICDFLRFYQQNKQYLKSIFVIKSIVLNYCTKNQPYTNLFNTTWMDLDRISLQRNKQFYDSLNKQQFQRFLIQANKQAQYNQNMKIQININFLYKDLIDTLSKIKLNCQMIITINYITLQTYKALKYIQSQSIQKINFISSIQPQNYQDEIQINIGVLQMIGDQYQSQLQKIVNFNLNVQNVHQKSIKLRLMFIQCFKTLDQVLVNYQQFEKQLLNLYSFNNSRFFTLRVVHYMDCCKIIDQFQQWSQVQNLSYYNLSSTQFYNIKPVFHITQLTVQRLKKFINLKLIVIDIVELNQRKRTQSLTDVQININQQTLLHIYQLIQQFKQIQFKFVDTKAMGGKLYLDQQNFDTFNKMKVFFLKYENGKRIKIINNNDHYNNKSQKQLMLIKKEK